MAEKKTKKKNVKKPLPKRAKYPAKPSPLKTKPKATVKKKISSKKPVARKPLVKPSPKKSPGITTLKNPKSISPKINKPAPKKPALKKVSLKTKPKTTSKTQIPLRTPPQKVAVEMSEDQRNIIMRRVLIRMREDIVKEAKAEISKYIKGETRQLVDTALDNGDWSIVDLSEDISLRQLGTHRETLFKIDEALRKLYEGTYGICEDCGDEISNERMKVLPFASYCIDCQERREELEAIAKREGIG
jgi:DnaK suppressor protein